MYMQLDKRGVSEVITTILFVLLALAAVIIVGAFIRTQLIGTTSQATLTKACFDLALEPLSCKFESRNLIASYSFEGNANDGSGNGNTGVLAGPTSFVDGKVGQAISLDGTGYVDLGNPADFNPGASDFTVETWVKRGNDKNVETIIGKGTMEGNFAWGVAYVAGNIRASFSQDGTWGVGKPMTTIVALKNNPLPQGEWHHIAVVFKPSQSDIDFYIDGVKQNDEAEAGLGQPTSVFASPTSAKIGDGFSGSFVGAIDEVKLYNKALTESEIKNEYNGISPAPISPNLIPIDVSYYMGLGASLTDFEVSDFAFLGEEDTRGIYQLDVHYLDSGKNILSRKIVSAYFFVYDSDVELTDTSVMATFEDIPSAQYVRVYWNGTLLFEKDFRALACNKNNVCENKYSDPPITGLFENALSCPSDCNRYASDGICMKAPGAEYSYNDYYCDQDCVIDTSADLVDGDGVSYGGECVAIAGVQTPVCNDNIQNQDETSVDVGGICDTMNAYCGDNICQANAGEDFESCSQDCADKVYCDIDNALKTQKTSSEECTNNFECESNVCSGGTCLEVTGFATKAEVSAFKSFFVNLWCGFIHPFDEYERNTCIAGYLEEVAYSPPAGLVASYSFEGNANDGSGSGNDGNLYPGITFVPGKVGQAASFSETTSVLMSNPSALNFGSSNFTVEAWVKRGAGDELGEIVGYGTLPNNYAFGVYYINSGRLSARFSQNGGYIFSSNNGISIAKGTGENADDVSGIVLPQDTWTHIAVVFKPSQSDMDFYVNGILQDEYVADYSTPLPTSVYTSTSNAFIGTGQSAGPMTGMLDEVKIYSGALTAEDVKDLYGGFKNTRVTFKRGPQKPSLELKNVSVIYEFGDGTTKVFTAGEIPGPLETRAYDVFVLSKPVKVGVVGVFVTEAGKEESCPESARISCI